MLLSRNIRDIYMYIVHHTFLHKQNKCSVDACFLFTPLKRKQKQSRKNTSYLVATWIYVRQNGSDMQLYEVHSFFSFLKRKVPKRPWHRENKNLESLRQFHSVFICFDEKGFAKWLVRPCQFSLLHGKHDDEILPQLPALSLKFRPIFRLTNESFFSSTGRKKKSGKKGKDQGLFHSIRQKPSFVRDKGYFFRSKKVPSLTHRRFLLFVSLPAFIFLHM